MKWDEIRNREPSDIASVEVLVDAYNIKYKLTEEMETLLRKFMESAWWDGYENGLHTAEKQGEL